MGAKGTAEKVSVAVPEPLMETADSEAETPGGVPLADSATVPVNPPTAATVITVLVPPPGGVLTDAGLADSRKSGFTVTVRFTGVL